MMILDFLFLLFFHHIHIWRMRTTSQPFHQAGCSLVFIFFCVCLSYILDALSVIDLYEPMTCLNHTHFLA